MGTQWQISLGTQNEAFETLRKPESTLSVAVQLAVVQELERINALMSTWDPTSELSLFNANRSLKPVTLHPDTLAVLQQALTVSEATDGAYDVTRGNVFKLWGFSRDTPQPTPPSLSDLAQALAQSGWQSIDISANAVSKRFPATTIDLSSIAKGFAVDRIGELLEQKGISHYVVNIGGEIRTRGEQSENRPWRIGVEQPNASSPTGLELTDAHVATSGSYRNVRIIDGRRVSHLIDGRSGQPTDHNLVAVTLLHESTQLADAWATAFMVLGVKDAKAYAIEHALAVQLTLLEEPKEGVEKPPQFSLWASPKWGELESVAMPSRSAVRE